MPADSYFSEDAAQKVTLSNTSHKIGKIKMKALNIASMQTDQQAFSLILVKYFCHISLVHSTV